MNSIIVVFVPVDVLRPEANSVQQKTPLPPESLEPPPWTKSDETDLSRQKQPLWTWFVRNPCR